MNEPSVIIDAGPLVALLSERDAHHEWAADTASSLPSPFLSSEPAITEACFLLQRANLPLDQLFSLLSVQSLVLDLDIQIESSTLAGLVRKYAVLPRHSRMSLADASLVRLAELHNQAAVFTLDRHFELYRKNGRQQIPLIAPWINGD